MVISIPLSPENPKARIRFEEAVPEFSTEMLWNGNMKQVSYNPAFGKECNAESKDGALFVSGKGGDGCGLIFKKGEIIRKVSEENLVEELMNEIEKM